MEEVQVNIKKASKFIDLLIKVVTGLSFLLFLLSFYIYRYKAGEIYKRQVVLCDTVWSQGLTEQNPLDNPIHEAFLDVKKNCFDNAGRTAETWGRIAFLTFNISILLPIIYFGGIKVVKDSAEKIRRVHKLE